jgi:hypothetical protein
MIIRIHSPVPRSSVTPSPHTLIGFGSMAKLAVLPLLLAVAASATTLAHGSELPTQIKVTHPPAFVHGFLRSQSVLVDP